jgi:hypothetical protein
MSLIFLLSLTLHCCTQFFSFEKYQVLVQNTKGLSFSFIEKRLFVIKIGQKFKFHHREAYILAQLDITVLYTFF